MHLGRQHVRDLGRARSPYRLAAKATSPRGKTYQALVRRSRSAKPRRREPTLGDLRHRAHGDHPRSDRSCESQLRILRVTLSLRYSTDLASPSTRATCLGISVTCRLRFNRPGSLPMVDPVTACLSKTSSCLHAKLTGPTCLHKRLGKLSPRTEPCWAHCNCRPKPHAPEGEATPSHRYS